jgi:DnaK suppressor protein
MGALRSSAERFRGFAPADEGDMATEGAEDELVLRLMELRSEEIAEVEEAIVRLGKGRYGLCEHCGKRIPAMRLRLMPAARYCVECQSTVERESAESDEMTDWSEVGEGNWADRHEASVGSVTGSRF